MANSTQVFGFCIASPPDWYINATNWVFGVIAVFVVVELIVKITTGRWAH